MDDEAAATYLGKTEESLAGAEREFAAGAYNNCVNWVYYACFQAAIAALLEQGIRPSSPDRQWSHAFVESQFVGQLINWRHRYPGDLRSALSQNRLLRERADYQPQAITATEAGRSIRRGARLVQLARGSERTVSGAIQEYGQRSPSCRT